MKEQKYTLTVTERQLRLIADCVEDCHRFAAGQMELYNTTLFLRSFQKLQERLKDLKPLVTLDAGIGEYYRWDGRPCNDELQRNFIAETYAIYREILHRCRVINKKPNDSYSVYDSPTLTCDEGGPLPIIEKARED